MGLKVIEITTTEDTAARFREIYAIPGPVLANVEINPEQKLYPVLNSAPLWKIGCRPWTRR